MSTGAAAEKAETDRTPAPEPEPDTDEGRKAETGTDEPNKVTALTIRETHRWQGIAAVALVLGAAGVLVSSPGLVLSAVVGVAYAAYARGSSAPTVTLAVERAFDETAPDPGDEVRVTVRVRNVGERTLPDLRLVDGVPPSLPVVAGTPRLGTALRPGEGAVLSYVVGAKRGTHRFEELTAISRGFAGSEERAATVETDGELVCTPSLTPTRSLPLRALTSQYAGRVETQSGGEGVEFFAVREYRRGDSLSRVDWNHHAKTGELTTLQFREERAATVVIVLDLRSSAYCRESDEGLHAVDRGVDAAGQLVATLIDAGDRVGVATFGPRDAWLAPGTGNEHRARVQELFATHPALSSEPPHIEGSVVLARQRLRRRLPADAQVIFVSPLSDRAAERTARLLESHGHHVTVVSPDPTADRTVGHRVARVERTNRITDLRGAGLRVVDWSPEEVLAAAVARAERRWSA